MSLVLVVTVVVFIVSEKVTEMFSLIEIPLWLSVGEIEETVGAVVSVVVSVVVVVLSVSVMRGNKIENSHIHILESETLSREYKLTESAQEIVDLIPYI